MRHELILSADFSAVNLQYLIQARDLARVDQERVAVLLGLSESLAELLAHVTPEELAQLPAIKVPLVAPRLEPWWWSRLLNALRDGEPDEVKAVLEHLGLLLTP